MALALSWLGAGVGAEPVVDAAPPRPVPAELRWDAPAGLCPSAAQLRTSIAELAGRWPDASELDVMARVSLAPDGTWALELTTRVRETSHVQNLHAQRCPALADAAALIVAVSIDPVASAAVAVRRVEPDARPEPNPALWSPSEPAAEPVAEPAAGPAASPAAALLAEDAASDSPAPARPFVGLGVGVVTGSTPGVSAGPRLALGLDFERGRVALEGRYGAPRSVSEPDGIGARVQVGTAVLGGCIATRRRSIRPMACAGLEAGVIRADGRGIGNPTTRYFPRLAMLAGAGLRWAITERVAATLDLEAAISALDAIVVVGALDAQRRRVIYATPRVGVRGLLGFEIVLSRGKD